MEILGAATRVTIYIGESDRWGQKSLYMAILEFLKAEDCAGATVTRGLAGFGAHSRIHTAGIVDLSSDLPIIIEWVDDPARVVRIMPRIVEMVAEGLVTCQPVEVVAYSHRGLRALPAGAPVHNLMSREVRAVGPDAPIADAVEILIGQGYRSLPVVDGENRVVGILTDGDVLVRLNLPTAGVQTALTAAEVSQEIEMLRRSGQTVRDVMVSPVVTVGVDASVADAVRLMTERGIKRLPVVDRDGRLTGIVSRLDVLRALAQPPLRELPPPVAAPGATARVGDVMRASVLSVRADAPIHKVVDLLLSAAARRVVVIGEGQRVVGIITDGDLLSRASAVERPGLLHAFRGGDRGATIDLAKRSAGDVMTPNPVTVTAETPLLEALSLLLQHKIKWLPVVDAGGGLIGLIGRAEILQALARDLPVRRDAPP